MIFITGDTHGDFKRIEAFCRRMDTKKEDILIILGDVGINYHRNIQDTYSKKILSSLPITIFCVHGNHEIRPIHIEEYHEEYFLGGIAYVESQYPNIIFAKDGEIYDFGKKMMVIGGAYSVDKYYRIAHSLGWWEDEMPSKQVQLEIEHKFQEIDYKIAGILSHTAPKKYVDLQAYRAHWANVDKSVEEWLDRIEEKLDYEAWYCGHFHINKRMSKMIFLYEDIVEMGW